ncbi:MAG: hypothetical protein MJK15_02580 [Colwellia sp.]|nr:hypothetical protein [Colwellia sp.]
MLTPDYNPRVTKVGLAVLLAGGSSVNIPSGTYYSLGLRHQQASKVIDEYCKLTDATSLPSN